jgi:C1A family cysteine protease
VVDYSVKPPNILPKLEGYNHRFSIAMRIFQRFSRIWLTLMLGFQFCFVSVAQELPGQERTGLRRPDASEVAWMRTNLVRTHKVLINPLAAQRIKSEAGNAGPTLLAVPYGNEIPVQNQPQLQSVTASPVLPAYIDNSTLPSFPPVRSQGSIGSCASFSTVYYVGSHMLGLVRGFNNKNDADNSTKLSPKWTYPMVNGGQDSGSWFTPAFDILIKHGGATWADFPYSGVNTPSSYREWCRDGATWRKAVDYRFNQSGTVPDLDTQTGLNNLKTLLADGYCLLYATDIYGWQFTNISDDPSTSADDSFVGKQACYVAKADSSGHAMTVVGYNDNIWIDINKNGVVDAGEKGALLICNSWGTSWKNGGFTWISYDALKQVSSVPGADNSNRVPAWWDQQAYWINARPNYAPRVLAQFTLNHSARSEINVSLGTSAPGGSAPTTFFNPAAIQSQGGAFAFDGTTTPVNSTFVFDFTDLVVPAARRYFLKVTDYASGRVTTVSDFRLIDTAGNTLTVASAGVSGHA